MTKALFSAVMFALLTSLSLGSHAAANTSPSETPAAVQVTSVNLNTADVDTLTRVLKGIGATKAQAIVDYREAHGPFSSVDDLLEVKGIGAATLEKNRANLTIN